MFNFNSTLQFNAQQKETAAAAETLAEASKEMTV
jgi:hypothetical protein